MTKIGSRRKLAQKSMKRKQIKLYPLDLVFSKVIKIEVVYTCEYCGKKGVQLHCHHGVVGRRYRNTRYEKDNCAVVCVGCHWFLGDFPQINTAFFLKRIGSDRMEQLQIIARSGHKPDLELIKSELTEKLKRLGNESD